MSFGPCHSNGRRVHCLTKSCWPVDILYGTWQESAKKQENLATISLFEGASKLAQKLHICLPMMILYTSSFTGCGTPKSLFRLLMIVDLNIGGYKLQRPVIQATRTIEHYPHRDRFAFHSSIFPNWPVFFWNSAEVPLPVNTCRFAMRSACLSALVSWKLVSMGRVGCLFEAWIYHSLLARKLHFP